MPLAFIIKYRHFIGYGLAVVALIASVWYIHHRGYEACQAAIAIERAKVNEKAIQGRKEIEHETKNMDNIELLDDLRFHGELRDEADL